MKLGRIVLGMAFLAILAHINKPNDRGKITYHNDCKQEYIDIEVYNDITTGLPEILRTPDGCFYTNIRFRNELVRHQYFALEQKDRVNFRVKASYKQEVLEINEIYNRNSVDNKTIELYISNNMLIDNKCIAHTWNTYCFAHDVYVPGLVKIEAVVDTSGKILSYKELQQL